MKVSLLVIIFVGLTIDSCLSQVVDFVNIQKISINGISQKSGKDDLIKAFGKPDTLFDPKYECGAFATEWSNYKSVVLYRYSNCDFLVVDDFVFFQVFKFNVKNDFQLKMDKVTITKETNIDDLKEFFPNSFENWKTDVNGIFRLWPCEKCDGEIQFKITNGFIEQIEFWEPC